jgi:uncharacterized damage-inducible protein DinB
LREALLEEFELEMEHVRKHLERVPEGKDAWKPAEKSMPLGWLAMFDQNVKSGREALARITEAQLEQPWSLKSAGNTLWTRPKWLVLRTFFLNHAIHHRAQLGVYLRLLRLAVPAVYNDSADEKGGMFRT